MPYHDDGREADIRKLEADGYRVLRPLPTLEQLWFTAMPPPGQVHRLAVLDLETTGTEPTLHEPIEIAIVVMTIDAVTGALIDMSEPRSWLEQPSTPISAEIEGLTGISNAMVAARQFDDAAIEKLLRSVHLVTAWNCGFDLSFMAARFPQIYGLPWGCSMREVDWYQSGFDGRALGHVLASAGYHLDGAHRASADAWATACLLSTTAPDGRTHAAHLFDAATRKTVLVMATRAPFSLSPTLRMRGYRWQPSRKCWAVEVDEQDAPQEVAALALLHPLIMPQTEVMDATTRHIRW